MFNLVYSRINLKKKKRYKVLGKSNYFLIAKREFYAVQKCSGCFFKHLEQRCEIALDWESIW